MLCKETFQWKQLNTRKSDQVRRKIALRRILTVQRHSFHSAGGGGNAKETLGSAGGHGEEVRIFTQVNLMKKRKILFSK